MDNSSTNFFLFRPAYLFALASIIVVLARVNTVFSFTNLDQSNTVLAMSDSTDGYNQSMEKGIPVKNVTTVIVDDNNVKWFCTDMGIVSYDGQNWKQYNGNEHLPNQNLKGITYISDPEGPELWVASPNGATHIKLPIEPGKEVATINTQNTSILDNEVLGIAAGKNTLRWFGSSKGISVMSGDAWLEPFYGIHYPPRIFKKYPITSMVTNTEGDSCYVGTAGAGVARVYRDEYDGISGASVYAQWGPIIIPSDNILSIYIAPNGAKWFGTDEGIARHTGNDTLENWTAYTTEDGLIDNFVQAICGDRQGNIWFGTKAGISVFDGSSWISYTTDNGLASNNIRSIAVDNDGIIWFGTDTGISCYKDNEFINY